MIQRQLNDFPLAVNLISCSKLIECTQTLISSALRYCTVPFAESPIDGLASRAILHLWLRHPGSRLTGAALVSRTSYASPVHSSLTSLSCSWTSRAVRHLANAPDTQTWLAVIELLVRWLLPARTPATERKLRDSWVERRRRLIDRGTFDGTATESRCFWSGSRRRRALCEPRPTRAPHGEHATNDARRPLHGREADGCCSWVPEECQYYPRVTCRDCWIL